MPYPILTLPYPFAKRLRQLLNPFELEQLQIAAGHTVTNPLKPIVTLYKDYGVHFQGNITADPNVITTCELTRISLNNRFYSHNKINTRKNDQYFINCNAVILINMSTTALESNQGPEFRLHLRATTANVHITDKIKPFIDPRFQHTDSENGNLVVSYKRFITIDNLKQQQKMHLLITCNSNDNAINQQAPQKHRIVRPCIDYHQSSHPKTHFEHHSLPTYSVPC
uniref:BPI2 domain-containing protein n=1 Tax=Panagrellus redivivus TaxID=6233 RepID=A0A7E4UPS8_PANRE